jgi:hypothetical protein
MSYLQQGDVLLHIEKLPKTATMKVEDPVIEHGEHTGHAHRLSLDMGYKENPAGSDKWALFKDDKTGERYLKVLEPTDLTHEEHKTITIPPGEYRVGRVLEYDHFAEEARVVQD